MLNKSHVFYFSLVNMAELIYAFAILFSFSLTKLMSAMSACPMRTCVSPGCPMSSHFLLMCLVKLTVQETAHPSHMWESYMGSGPLTSAWPSPASLQPFSESMSRQNISISLNFPLCHSAFQTSKYLKKKKKKRRENG